MVIYKGSHSFPFDRYLLLLTGCFYSPRDRHLDIMSIHDFHHRPEGGDQIIRIVMPLCPKPERCILGSLAPLCLSCFRHITESTFSEALSQAMTHATSSTDVEMLFAIVAASSESPRPNVDVTYPSRFLSGLQQTLTLTMHPQTSFFQVPQTSSQQFIPMDHGLQKSCTTKVMCLSPFKELVDIEHPASRFSLSNMYIRRKQPLPSVDRQVQLNKSPHKGQQNTNNHLVTEPRVASHPTEKDQAMVRKIKDKMARKPLTEAEKNDIINRVRGENGQSKSYRQVSKESGYPISTICRVVKKWREETVSTKGTAAAPTTITNGKSALIMLGVHQ